MKYNIKSLLYKASAILILVFTVVYSFQPTIAVWGMVVGVSMFSAITLTTPYPGKSIRGKRLFNFQVFACVLLVVATFLMYKQRNEWPVLLLISAIFLFYSSIVLQKELEKEQIGDDKK
jgi:phosphatidylserine synthase